MSAKGLGKDFSALIPDDMLSEALAVGGASDTVTHLPIVKIHPDPTQPRRHFDEAALDELAASINQHGIVQPLIVAKNGGEYLIVAGERRYRAAQIVGLTEVPVVVRSFGDQERLEISLIENVQRSDLTKLEQAAAYLRLHEEFNLEYKVVAARVGKSESAVVNIMRLLKLPNEAKQALNAGAITEGHARQIVALKDLGDQLELLSLIIKNSWTVRQAEQFVVGIKNAAKQKNEDKSGEGIKRTRFETTETKRLSKRLGAPVQIKNMAKGGQLVIKFKDEAHLEKLMGELL